MSRKLLVGLLALYILGTSLQPSFADNKALKKAVEELCNAWDKEYPPSDQEVPTSTSFLSCIANEPTDIGKEATGTGNEATVTGNETTGTENKATATGNEATGTGIEAAETERIMACAEKILFSFILKQMNDESKPNIEVSAKKCLNVFNENKISNDAMPNLKKLAGDYSIDNEALKNAVKELFKAWDAEYPPSSPDDPSVLHVFSECINPEVTPLPTEFERIMVCTDYIVKVFISDPKNDESKSSIQASAEKCFGVFKQNEIPKDDMPNFKALAKPSQQSSSANDEALKNAVVKLCDSYDTEYPPINLNLSTSAQAFSTCIEKNELPSKTGCIMVCAEMIFNLFLRQNNGKTKSNIKEAANECLAVFKQEDGIPDDNMPNLKILAGIK